MKGCRFHHWRVSILPMRLALEAMSKKRLPKQMLMPVSLL
jgi:hypothetical protein